jgi:hypothetical protein
MLLVLCGGGREGGHLKAFLWAETENPDKSGILAEIKTNGRLGLFTHSCPTSHTNQALDPGTEYPIRCQTQRLTAMRHGAATKANSNETIVPDTSVSKTPDLSTPYPIRYQIL